MSEQPKFELKQKVIHVRFPGSPGIITDIRQNINLGCPHYRISSYSGDVAEYDIEGVPDTVTIEIPRDVAEMLVESGNSLCHQSVGPHLVRASRKALERP